MFLKELYRYSKTGFFVVLVFLLAYIYINFKWGVVATPILQYGMYSAPSYLADTQEVYMLTVNKQPVNCGELSFVDRDIVQVCLNDYEKQQAVNAAVYHTLHRYLSFTGLMNYNNYSNHLSDTSFTRWYRSKLEKIMRSSIDSLSVSKQNFVWRQNSLQPSGTLLKISFIVPEQ